MSELDFRFDVILKKVLVPLQNILAKLRKTTYINNDAEITLELNPSKEMTLKQLEEFLDAGINRFSIGIQV